MMPDTGNRILVAAKSIEVAVKRVRGNVDASREISVIPLPDGLTNVSDSAGHISVTLDLADEILFQSVGPSSRVAADRPWHVVVGDYTEPGALDGTERCGNAVLFHIDFRRGSVTAVSSIIGLPPVFYTAARDSLLVTSPLLPRSLGNDLRVDVEAVADILRWGYPIDGRTLFAAIKAMQAHSRLSIEVGCPPKFESVQVALDAAVPRHLEAPELMEEQISSFEGAISRLPTETAFLSLSGGLDSRAVLMALVKGGKPVSCVSLASSRASLDLKHASEYCRALGVHHQTVPLTTEFMKGLPDAAITAARITGGVSCLSQSVDLYLYTQIGDRFNARLSGNLGNQVGRGGVEGLSVTDVPGTFLGVDVKDALARRPRAPWFVPRIPEQGYPEVLFAQEAPYSSVANYMLGSKFARQLSPYTDAKVIDLARISIAGDPRFAQMTVRDFRKRDLRHRLVGPPLSRSFQRAFLQKYDVLGRNIPVNWGWLVGGGWRWQSRLRALHCVGDAYLLKLARTSRLAAPLETVSSYLGHPSAFVPWPEVLRARLRPLVYDVLLSQVVRDAGLFEAKQLRQALDDHFKRRINIHDSIVKMLEIGLGLTACRDVAPASLQ